MKQFLNNFIRLYRFFLILLNMPFVLSEYFRKSTGEEYGVGFFTKLFLIVKMYRNTKVIPSVSSYLEHFLMATKLLNIPKALEGSIVECGCYKGGSTANLSLVCASCGRQLEVFDSFRGLPQPSIHDRAHAVLDTHEVHTYAKGSWHGSIEEVKGNVSRYGKIEVCNFHVGYFDDTLSIFKSGCAFIFLDVDLRDSLETCLKYLWPLLQDECYLFTHEAPHMEIASLFFDKAWWREHLNSKPPGLVGAGSGIGLVPESGGFKSALGYTVKNPRLSDFTEIPQDQNKEVKYR